MTYYIGSARHDEHGRYTGGKAGDQTGQEVATQKMYDYISKGGWRGLRPKKPTHAVGIQQAMLTACGNKHIGYSQSDRYGVIRNGVNTKVDTNSDCSTLVRACVEAGTGVDVGDFTTLSEYTALMNSGLFIDLGTVTTHSKLYEGDILVTNKKGHTAIVTTGYDRILPYATGEKKSSSDLRSVGLGYAKAFCNADEFMANNSKTRARVLQHALNLDYGAGLKEDGIIGWRTEKALGSHYVAYGEKQYMVSCAEILVYLHNGDPKGFEEPGIYGNGLKKATGLKKLNSAWFLKYAE